MNLIELYKQPTSISTKKTQANTSAKIKISFKKPLDKNYDSANIYIASGDAGWWKEEDFYVNTKSTTVFVEKINGLNVQYDSLYTVFILSVNKRGIENRAPESIRRLLVRTPIFDKIPPDVENFKLTESNEGIILTWDPVNYAEHVRYCIQMTSWNGDTVFLANVIACVDSTRFVYSTQMMGDFTFCIKAFDSFGHFSKNENCKTISVFFLNSGTPDLIMQRDEVNGNEMDYFIGEHGESCQTIEGKNSISLYHRSCPDIAIDKDYIVGLGTHEFSILGTVPWGTDTLGDMTEFFKKDQLIHILYKKFDYFKTSENGFYIYGDGFNMYCNSIQNGSRLFPEDNPLMGPSGVIQVYDVGLGRLPSYNGIIPLVPEGVIAYRFYLDNLSRKMLEITFIQNGVPFDGYTYQLNNTVQNVFAIVGSTADKHIVCYNDIGSLGNLNSFYDVRVNSTHASVHLQEIGDANKRNYLIDCKFFNGDIANFADGRWGFCHYGKNLISSDYSFDFERIDASTNLPDTIPIFGFSKYGNDDLYCEQMTLLPYEDGLSTPVTAGMKGIVVFKGRRAVYPFYKTINSVIEVQNSVYSLVDATIEIERFPFSDILGGNTEGIGDISACIIKKDYTPIYTDPQFSFPFYIYFIVPCNGRDDSGREYSNLFNGYYYGCLNREGCLVDNLYFIDNTHDKSILYHSYGYHIFAGLFIENNQPIFEAVTQENITIFGSTPYGNIGSIDDLKEKYNAVQFDIVQLISGIAQKYYGIESCHVVSSSYNDTDTIIEKDGLPLDANGEYVTYSRMYNLIYKPSYLNVITYPKEVLYKAFGVTSTCYNAHTAINAENDIIGVVWSEDNGLGGRQIEFSTYGGVISAMISPSTSEVFDNPRIFYKPKDPFYGNIIGGYGIVYDSVTNNKSYYVFVDNLGAILTPSPVMLSATDDTSYPDIVWNPDYNQFGIATRIGINQFSLILLTIDYNGSNLVPRINLTNHLNPTTHRAGPPRILYNLQNDEYAISFAQFVYTGPSYDTNIRISIVDDQATVLKYGTPKTVIASFGNTAYDQLQRLGFCQDTLRNEYAFSFYGLNSLDLVSCPYVCFSNSEGDSIQNGLKPLFQNYFLTSFETTDLTYLNDSFYTLIHSPTQWTGWLVRFNRTGVVTSFNSILDTQSNEIPLCIFSYLEKIFSIVRKPASILGSVILKESFQLKTRLNMDTGLDDSFTSTIFSNIMAVTKETVISCYIHDDMGFANKFTVMDKHYNVFPSYYTPPVMPGYPTQATRISARDYYGNDLPNYGTYSLHSAEDVIVARIVEDVGTPGLFHLYASLFDKYMNLLVYDTLVDSGVNNDVSMNVVNAGNGNYLISYIKGSDFIVRYIRYNTPALDVETAQIITTPKPYDYIGISHYERIERVFVGIVYNTDTTYGYFKLNLSLSKIVDIETTYFCIPSQSPITREYIFAYADLGIKIERRSEDWGTIISSELAYSKPILTEGTLLSVTKEKGYNDGNILQNLVFNNNNNFHLVASIDMMGNLLNHLDEMYPIQDYASLNPLDWHKITACVFDHYNDNCILMTNDLITPTFRFISIFPFKLSTHPIQFLEVNKFAIERNINNTFFYANYQLSHNEVTYRDIVDDMPFVSNIEKETVGNIPIDYNFFNGFTTPLTADNDIQKFRFLNGEISTVEDWKDSYKEQSYFPFENAIHRYEETKDNSIYLSNSIDLVSTGLYYIKADSIFNKMMYDLTFYDLFGMTWRDYFGLTWDEIAKRSNFQSSLLWRYSTDYYDYFEFKNNKGWIPFVEGEYNLRKMQFKFISNNTVMGDVWMVNHIHIGAYLLERKYFIKDQGVINLSEYSYEYPIGSGVYWKKVGFTGMNVHFVNELETALGFLPGMSMAFRHVITDNLNVDFFYYRIIDDNGNLVTSNGQMVSFNLTGH
jgi:hypothetical protein